MWLQCGESLIKGVIMGRMTPDVFCSLGEKTLKRRFIDFSQIVFLLLFNLQTTLLKPILESRNPHTLSVNSI